MSPPDAAWDDWKKVLLTLPDETFFTLVRNYLGELKTPFNKHSMIHELIQWVSRPAIVQTICECLDEDDRVILCAIGTLDDPIQSELMDFLGMAELELGIKLLNLEERLLIYRIKSPRGGLLRLSPLMGMPVLKNRIDSSGIFTPHEAEELPPQTPWLSDALLLAMHSFFSEKSVTRTAQGRIHKRSLAELEQRFAPLFEGSGDPERLELVVDILLRLGLLIAEEGELKIHFEGWTAFAGLDAEKRLALICCAACGLTPEVMMKTAPWVFPILEAIPSANAFSQQTLVRWIAGNTPLADMGRIFRLVAVWETLGFLRRNSQGFLQVDARSRRVETSVARSPVVLQANFELTVNPNIDLSLLLTLGAATRLIGYDLVSRYELTKASYQRLLAQGGGSADFLAYLERVCGLPLSQNIRFSLGEWEKEYASLRVYKGCVLVVDESRRFLLEHSEGFGKYVVKTLAPGIFLLRDGALVPWRKELQQLGLPGLPEPEEAAGGKNLGVPWSFTRWDATSVAFPQVEAGAPEPSSVSSPPPGDHLRLVLEATTLSADEKSELNARIGRKLILTESQLTAEAAKGERVEAKGLDYLGKIRLIEQTLTAAGDYIEVVQRGPEGQPVRTRVKPYKLDKNGKEVLLWGLDLATNKDFRAYVSRLSSVRKIRTSLFS